MNIPITVYEIQTEKTYIIHLKPEDDIEKAKRQINFFTNIDPKKQLLTFQTKILINSDTVSKLGIRKDDVIYLSTLKPLNRQNFFEGIDLGSISSQNLRRFILNHEELNQYIRQHFSDLHKAVVSPSPHLMEQYLAPIRKQKNNERKVKEEFLREQRIREKLRRNPLDVDAQRELYNFIQKKNIDESFDHAQEFHPELFGRVNMLYIPVKVEGVDVKAFVDTGAQMSIMSKNFAEKCNAMKLLDKRYSGIARGVGQGVIIGRIHLIKLQLGDSFFEHSVSVMDTNMDLLLGLDFLKRHQCSITLKENELICGEERLKFLPESQLPKSFQDELRSPGSPLPRATSTPMDMNDKVETIMGIAKCSKEEAKMMVEQAKGNIELALSLLFEKKSMLK